MYKHQASEQMLGYLYQVRYALYLLLDNENPDSKISIEKFDDVSFEENDIPTRLLQLKHHVKSNGDLSDSSADLWRTLQVWIDAVKENHTKLDETDFVIITTAKAPKDSAAYYLRNHERNVSVAYDKLQEVTKKSTNKANFHYYDSFKNFDRVKNLLERIYILDCASNILDVEKDLRKKIRYSCTPKFENQVFERLEGWWFKKVIDALNSSTPTFIKQSQIRNKIFIISQEYTDDNLPIDFFDTNVPNSDLSTEQKVFCEQLKLICVHNRRLQLAIQDYYRAYQQRAQWVRNDLLYIDEIERYEERLIDEWKHAFASMEDEILSCDITEDEKTRKGRELLTSISNLDISIRPKCREPFIMRGSYHMLADQLKVGWHVDFLSRLQHLLNSKGGL